MTNPPQSHDVAGRPAGDLPEGPESSQQKLHALLAGVWERSKKNIAVHVGTLQEARARAGNGALDEASRERAAAAAHKLAGVLGTFGLPRGTELARAAEQILEAPGALDRSALERLGATLDELDRLIQTAAAYPLANPQRESDKLNP